MFDSAHLSTEARELYLAILHGAEAPQSAPLGELLEFGLVVPCPNGSANAYIALSPREAANTRRERILQQTAGAMAEAAAIPERFRDLEIAYQITGPDQSDVIRGAVEYIEGVEPINARISQIVAGCTQEVLTAQPDGPRPAATLAMSRHRDIRALRDGLAFRTLYHASVRSDSPTAGWTAEMTSEGAQIRTLDERFMRALIFDRRKAVLQDYTPWTGPGAEPRRAMIIHDEGLVHYVAAMFDRDWSRASVWTGLELPSDSTLTELQVSIMRHLATGAGQATVANELSISERSVQAELGKMRRALGAVSTVQMAYELGRQAGISQQSAGM
ncbi:LuxR C-terminal-related transcriptional regulator [Kitasatospora sp. McL0602]|uniref:LuxR C-terminal-related transcriptional regulator n=1 Tax=Kitasatospora sp. McL0602 TaxID=3439530 RepID=UPI003F8B806E